MNTDTLTDLKAQVKLLQSRIEDLEKPVETHIDDVVIAAKVVHDYALTHSLEKHFNVTLRYELMVKARALGFTGSESALRVAYMQRKYWLRMKARNWS